MMRRTLVLPLMTGCAISADATERGGTFGTSNAVGHGAEIAILVVLVITFLGGLLYLVRVRPGSPP